MQNRIIRIALALGGCILLTAGCIRRSDLGSDGTPIGFAAGSTLLRDDATKAGTLKTGNQFTTGDKIAVFGWHDAIGGFIFNDQPVELKSSGRWEYAPVQPWECTCGICNRRSSSPPFSSKTLLTSLLIWFTLPLIARLSSDVNSSSVKVLVIKSFIRSAVSFW